MLKAFKAQSKFDCSKNENRVLRIYEQSLLIASIVVYHCWGHKKVPHFHKEDFNYGNICIISSFGRSGSTWLSYIAGRFCGAEKDNQLSHELFRAQEVPMEEIEDPLYLVRQYLQNEREKYPKGCIGFKWGPHVNTEAYDEVWRWLVANNAKVVHNKRNILDRYFSSVKHGERGAVPRCRPDDHECIDKMKNIQILVSISDMFEYLEEETDLDREVQAALDRNHVNHLEVSYGALSTGNDKQKIAELQRVADYLMGENWRPVTMDDFEANIVDISIPNTDLVSNYDEVKKALKGTKWYSLLHP